MEPQPIIGTKDLTKRYHHQMAVDHLNVRIMEKFGMKEASYGLEKIYMKYFQEV
jgi:hypothetical protein